MKVTKLKSYSQHLGLLTIGYLCLLPIWLNKFTEYISTSGIFGWDSSTHYSATVYYSRFIYPSLFGWNTAWDIPWPIGYNPLISWMTSLLYRLFNTVPTDLLFKLMLVFCSLLLPFSIYWLTHRLVKNKFLNFVAFALTAVFMLRTSSDTSFTDLTIEGIVTHGYIPFFIAAIPFILLIATLNNKKRHINFIHSTLLAITIITNTHVGIASVLLFIYYLVLYKNKLKHSLYFVFGIMISSFWWSGVLFNREYLHTVTFPPINLSHYVINTPFILVIIFVCLYNLYYRKNHYSLFPLIVVLLTLFPLNTLSEDLPWQPFRTIILALLTGLPAIAIFINSFKKALRVLVSFVVVILAVFSLKPDLVSRPNLYLPDDDTIELANYLKTVDGTSLIEFALDNKTPLSNYIAATIATDNKHRTLWNIYRESTYGSNFIQPLRNYLSPVDNESYGTKCNLCEYWASWPYVGNPQPELFRKFLEMSPEHQVEFAKYLGISHIVVKSEEAKALLSNLVEGNVLKKDKEFGAWVIYTTGANSVYNFVSPQNIVGVSTSDKDRWQRINELWSLEANHYFLFARIKKDLDDTDFYKDFENILILDYKYRDLHKAYSLLANYSQDHTVFLRDADDPLVNLLMGKENIRVLKEDFNSIDFLHTIRQLFSKPDSEIPLTGYSFVQTTNGYSLSLNNTTTGKKYLHLKRSYFPLWTSKTSEIYELSPYQMVVVIPDGSEHIELKLDNTPQLF